MELVAVDRERLGFECDHYRCDADHDRERRNSLQEHERQQELEL